MKSKMQTPVKYKKNKNHFAARQAAFTIVELLIAALLGILLIAGVVQLFVGSNRNYTLQTELANIQEDGRFAMIFLENEVQRGGWMNDFKSNPGPAVDMGRSADSTTDKLAISYTTLQNGVDNRDCNGAVVADGVVVNTFSVGGASGDSLMCLGNGGGVASPLIDGVKNFQVLYGVENALCPDGAVNQYMTHDQFVAAKNAFIVVSVRVALLMFSKENVLSASKNQTHKLLDNQVSTNTQLAYRTFQQTIYMPNAMYAINNDPSKTLSCASSII